MSSILYRLIHSLAGSNSAVGQRSLDRLVMQLLRWRNRPWFGAIADGPTLIEHLRQVHIPSLTPTAGWHEVMVGTAIGKLSLAVYFSADTDPTQPLLIYHHGAGEIPVQRGLHEARKAGPLPFRVVVIRGAGHRNQSELRRTFRSGEAALALIAASAALMEAVLCSEPQRPAVVTGVSLGGMVASCHAARFGARWLDQGRPLCWAPVVAGPDFARVLSHSAFARLCDRCIPPALIRRRLAGALNSGLPNAHMHPLLARWDLLHQPLVQGRMWRQLGVRPRFINRGHIGAALDGPALRQHWLSVAPPRL